MTTLSKTQQHEAVRERARQALRNLYHNATPTYPRELYGRTDAEAMSWFEGAAGFEIEYLKDGGAYGSNYRKTLAAPCNAGKYKSEKAQRYYIAKGMRAMEEERADCGAVTGWLHMEAAAGNPRLGMIFEKYPYATRNNSLWERISEFGELYSWGRGGRTLAPDKLVRQRGGSSFSINEEYADDLPIADVVDLIRVIESFNAYVGAWCKDVPNMWREHCKEEDAEKRAQRRRQREEAKEEQRRAMLRKCFC